MASGARLTGLSPRSEAEGPRSPVALRRHENLPPARWRPNDHVAHVENLVRELLLKHARMHVAVSSLAIRTFLMRISSRIDHESAQGRRGRAAHRRNPNRRIAGTTRRPGTPAARMAVISPSVDMRDSVTSVPIRTPKGIANGSITGSTSAKR